MVGRQDVENLYLGNLLFYRNQAKTRNRLFLDRNLQQALTSHRAALEGTAHRLAARTDFERRNWKMPEPEELDRERRKRNFRLEILGITPTNSDGSITATEGRPSKRATLFRKEIILHASIYHKESTHVCKSFNDHNATLEGTRTLQSIEAKLNTDVDFTVRPEEFKISSHGRKERSRIGEVYGVKISINFNNSRDSDDVLCLMGVTPSQSYSTRWLAKYENILSCPESDKSESVKPVILELKGVYEHRENRSVDLRLKVRMWYSTYPEESLLAAVETRAKAGLQSQRSLTTHKTDSARTNFKVVFAGPGERRRYDSLKCHFCDLRTHFRDINDLHMHLKSYHDNFKYCPTKEEEINGTQFWRIEYEIAIYRAEQQRASNNAPDAYSIEMVAPKRPFDQSAYLNDHDESWQREAMTERPTRFSLPTGPHLGMATRRKGLDEVQPRVSREKKKFRVPKAPSGVTFFRSVTKRPLVEGEYISESDDDADMEWLRLRTESMIIDDPNIPEKAKRFLNSFNLYLRDERPLAPDHLADLVLRFAQEKGSWIVKEDVQDAFKDKIAELLEDETISKEIHDESLKLVEGQQHIRQVQNDRYREHAGPPSHPTPPLTPTSTRNSPVIGESSVSNSTADRSLNITRQYNKSSSNSANRGNKRKTQATDLSHTTPQTVDYHGDVEMVDGNQKKQAHLEEATGQALRYDHCICGEAVSFHTGRSTIYCEGDVSHKAWKMDAPIC